MIHSNLIEKLISLTVGKSGLDYSYASGIDGIEVVFTEKPTALNAVLYEPVLCIVLQGAKETYLGSQRLGLVAGDSLIVSHELPVVSRVTKASPSQPFVSVVMTLEIAQIVALCSDADISSFERRQAHSMEVGPAGDEVIDILKRLVNLTDNPADTKVLLPLLIRELHYRLLNARHGEMLRHLLRKDSHASRIARAVDEIRRDFSTQLSVKALALKSNMGLSSFHVHFKRITETTPLQYQKDLRLLEARRLLLAGKCTVSIAAYQVGYESLSQFSREYSRKFGAAPSRFLSDD